MKGSAVYHSPVGVFQLEYEDDAVTALKILEADADSVSCMPCPGDNRAYNFLSGDTEHLQADYDNFAEHVGQNSAGISAAGAQECDEPGGLAALVFRQLDEYFLGRRKEFDFPIRMKGTPFQQKVWAALLEIPYGETRSYKDIAEAVGSPKAYRAVGMANNANPIFIAVPCHRVIGANGSLVGYGGGLDMKKALLELEKA